MNSEDPIIWAKEYIEELNEKEETREVLVKYSPSKIINTDEQHSFNGGYLFSRKYIMNSGCIREVSSFLFSATVKNRIIIA